MTLQRTMTDATQRANADVAYQVIDTVFLADVPFLAEVPRLDILADKKAWKQKGRVESELIIRGESKHRLGSMILTARHEVEREKGTGVFHAGFLRQSVHQRAFSFTCDSEQRQRHSRHRNNPT